MNDFINEETWNRVLVYGTGNISRRFITEHPYINVVGVSDRIKRSGCFCDFPIVSFFDLKRDEVDTVIIASAANNIKTIFERIVDRCRRNHWRIIRTDGRDLEKVFGIDNRSAIDNHCFRDSYDSLIREIDSHDAISFDMFDTLVTRQTIWSTDVLLLVEKKLSEKKIDSNNYYEERIASEHSDKYLNIYDIYKVLQKKMSWDDKTRDEAMNEEINCELSCIIPRIAMKEAFNYALKKNKKVSIISDMFFPEEILKAYLDNCGISGYDRLFVSCDYKMSKQSGELYRAYLDYVNGLSCLHIGDNYECDIKKAGEYGIDTFYIRSSSDLFGLSALKELSGFHESISDRILLGMLISDLFNDPFCLRGTGGVPVINSWEMFGKVIVAPLVIHFISILLKEIEKDKPYGILFAARDCYIFKKVYDSLAASGWNLPRSIYLYTSRKISIKTMIINELDIDILNKYNTYSNNCRDIMTHFLDIKNEEIHDGGFNSNVDLIMKVAKKTHDNFIKYLKREEIDKEEQFILCDLIAQGSSQYALKKMGFSYIKGVYYALFHGSHNYDLEIVSAFDEKDTLYNSFYRNNALLEELFSSPEPSANGFNDDGSPSFDEEIRDKEYLEVIDTIQNAAINEAIRFFSHYDMDYDINGDIPEYFFGYTNRFDYQNECSNIYEYKCEDNELFPWISRL